MQSTDRKMYTWIMALRFFAGFVNTSAILIVSEMLAGQTGRITKLVMSMVSGDITGAATMLSFLAVFILGCITSGYFYPEDKKANRMPYDKIYFVFGIILILVGFLSESLLLLGWVYAFILGFQNASYAFYKGSVVRTTILTGTMTDMGIEVGKGIHHSKPNWSKIKFHLNNMLFFMIGAALAGLFRFHTDWKLVVTAGVFSILLAVYFKTISETYREEIQK